VYVGVVGGVNDYNYICLVVRSSLAAAVAWLRGMLARSVACAFRATSYLRDLPRP
jgi:hypothetical protein